MDLGLSESIFEVSRSHIYQLKRRIEICSLCYKYIEDNKYICTIIDGYNIKSFYHKACYKVVLFLNKKYKI